MAVTHYQSSINFSRCGRDTTNHTDTTSEVTCKSCLVFVNNGSLSHDRMRRQKNRQKRQEIKDFKTANPDYIPLHKRNKNDNCTGCIVCLLVTRDGKSKCCFCSDVQDRCVVC